MSAFSKRNLLGIRDLSREEIEVILDVADSFKDISLRDIKKVPTLRGKTVIHFFYEPSTRTRLSFEIAAKRLSADTVSLSASSSSMEKGETLLDTVRNLEAMRPDVLVLRHPMAGSARFVADRVGTSVVNAGDGSHEHPTQALLDVLTVLDHKKRVDGLNISIVGDIANSRVARSAILAFSKLGAHVTVAGPPCMLPPEPETLGIRVTYRLDEAIEDADVIMMLRLQLERQQDPVFPSLREYSREYGLNRHRLRKAPKDVIILHPGPINRGVEIDPEVADGPYSVILDQVTNGVAVRMAVLYLLLGGRDT